SWGLNIINLRHLLRLNSNFDLCPASDKPGAPINFTFDETNKDCMFVAWDKPENDGGSPITGYYIERKERNSLLWVKANDTVVRTTEYPCAGLIEGLEYTFRVSAINRAGQGKPSKKTDFVTARTPIGSWKKPLTDGGSRIICYVLEVLNGDDKYKELMRSKNMQYSAKDLVEDREYNYRVKAVNDSGESSAKELKVVAKDQISKCLSKNIY
uniref:Fibronectin type-III domain-containing protein n=1 Tax=Labrus bergylta TaxID=56723 RepID=A0A3Q3GS02_9LABR